KLMDRFITAGINPCANNAVARALRHKARPLLGFIKSHKARFPELQRQVDIALHRFVDDGDEKGISLMMWLGANPMATVPSDPYSDGGESNQFHENALEAALWRGKPEIVRHLRIDKNKAPLDNLLGHAVHGHNPEIVEMLITMGANPNAQDEHG